VHDAAVLAGAVAAALVRRILPAGATAHPNGAEATADPWRDSPHHRGEIHQATGVITASLHLPVGAAYARLSGHAFVTGTTMAVVAHDVVARRLLLPETPGEPHIAADPSRTGPSRRATDPIPPGGPYGCLAGFPTQTRPHRNHPRRRIDPDGPGRCAPGCPGSPPAGRLPCAATRGAGGPLPSRWSGNGPPAAVVHRVAR
jgi:hypothetical protein